MKKISFLIFLSVILAWWSCSKKNSSGPENGIDPEILSFEFQKDSTKMGVDHAILNIFAKCPANPSYLYLSIMEGSGEIASVNPEITYDSTKSGSQIYVYKCVSDTLHDQFLINPLGEGILKVSAYLISDGVRSETHEAIVFVYSNLSPRADFMYYIQDSIYPIKIEFNGQASYDPDGQIREWHWIIDGSRNQSDSSSCVETFSEAREIAVELIVVDNEGASDSVQKKIQLTNRKPVPVIRYSIDQNHYPPLLYLNGTESYDPDGIIEKFTWIFEGDTLLNSRDEMQIELMNSGNYTVTLIVTDDQGDSESAQVEIRMTNLKPVAHFYVDELNQNYPRKFIANASQSTDPDGKIVKYHWRINNQSFRTVEVDTIHLSISNYVENLISLIVEDNLGMKDMVTQKIRPTNSLPLAEIDPEWDTVKIFYGEEQEILLTDNYVQDIDGNIVDFKWRDNGEIIKEYQQPVGEFPYLLTPGSHEIILEVTDEEGSSSDTVYAELIDEEIRVSIQVESGQISGPFPLSLDVTASLDFPADVSHFSSIEWEFGDGTRYVGLNPPVHIYPEGSFFMILTARTDWGGIGKDTLLITAHNVSPVAIINPDWQQEELHLNGPTAQINLSDLHCYDENGNIARFEWFLDNERVEDYGPDGRGEFLLSIEGYGEHTIKLKVTDSLWAEGIDSVIVYLVNTPPSVNLEITPGTVGTHPFLIQVNPIVTDPNGLNDLQSIEWNFGDGSPSAITNGIEPIEHVYSSPGQYTLTSTVTDMAGNQGRATETIVVNNNAPSAYFDVFPGPEGTVPYRVRFDAAGSNDPNQDVLEYEWNFGDGNVITTQDAVIEHTFDDRGGDGNREYEVILTVRDPYDKRKAEDTYSRTIRVRNTVPSPSITVLNNGGQAEGASQLNLELRIDPNDPDPGQNHLYRWQLLNQYRQYIRELGTTQQITSEIETGTFYVVCTVNDGYSEATAEIQVQSVNYPPEVSFHSQPSQGNYPLRVIFTPSVSDPNGIEDIQSFHWSFGDGGTILRQDNQSVSYTYNHPGNFSATLMVTDKAGNTSSFVREIRVINERPVPVLELLNDDRDNLENGALAGSTFQFSAVNTHDAETSDPNLYFRYFWDGNLLQGSGTGQTLMSYVPNQVGQYQVRLVVTDEYDLSASTAMMVNSYNRPPVIQGYSRTPSGSDLGQRRTIIYQFQASDPDENTPINRMHITFTLTYSYMENDGSGIGEIREVTMEQDVYDGVFNSQVRIDLPIPEEMVVSPINVQATIRIYDSVENVPGSTHFISKYDQITDSFSYRVD